MFTLRKLVDTGYLGGYPYANESTCSTSLDASSNTLAVDKPVMVNPPPHTTLVLRVRLLLLDT